MEVYVNYKAPADNLMNSNTVSPQIDGIQIDPLYTKITKIRLSGPLYTCSTFWTTSETLSGLLYSIRQLLARLFCSFRYRFVSEVSV